MVNVNFAKGSYLCAGRKCRNWKHTAAHSSFLVDQSLADGLLRPNFRHYNARRTKDEDRRIVVTISWTRGMNVVVANLGVDPDIWGSALGMSVMLGALLVIPFVDRRTFEPQGWAAAFDLRKRYYRGKLTR
jgi:hypothetical protein